MRGGGGEERLLDADFYLLPAYKGENADMVRLYVPSSLDASSPFARLYSEMVNTMQKSIISIDID